MFGIEDALADVVARSTQPALGAIKLAWWRDRLEELDERKVPAEPRLQAAAGQLLPRGLSGADLAQLAGGWSGLLHDPPDMALLTEHGATLFAFAARLLSVPFEDSTIGAAGRLFASVDAGRRRIIDRVAGSPATSGLTIPRPARPLTGLAALAARDIRNGGIPFEAEGTPARAWTLLRHRWSGRIG